MPHETSRTDLALKNLLGRPGRTAVLVILTALLSMAVLAGTMIVQSLRAGLGSLDQRLGADIMVVPYEATSKSSLESIVLQGNTGYFYMPKDRYEKILSTEGLGQVSPQFFLASTSSGSQAKSKRS